MALSNLTFDKDWTNPSDFPTVETNEADVRADIQYLFNAIKTYINGTLKTFVDNLQSGSGLANGSVDTAQLKDGAVTANKIASSAVTSGKLAASAVTSGKIAAGAVTTDEIADDAVTTGKIENGAVTSEKLSGLSITENMLGNGAVTTDKIADAAVTADKLSIDGKPFVVNYAKLGVSWSCNVTAQEIGLRLLSESWLVVAQLVYAVGSLKRGVSTCACFDRDSSPAKVCFTFFDGGKRIYLTHEVGTETISVTETDL